MNYEQKTMNYKIRNEPKTNPIYPVVASGEAGSEAKKYSYERNFYLTYIHRTAMYRLLIFYLEIQN